MGELTHPNSKIVLGDNITPIKRFNNICPAE